MEQKSIMEQLFMSAAKNLPANEDPHYQAALVYLKRGLSKQKIADNLVQDGISRAEATSLSTKVWRENSASRQTNARILIAFAVFLIFVGISLIIVRLLSSGEIPPLLSPAYVFFMMALYLAYKGFRDLKAA
jgi:hypothetical protein